MKRLVVVIALFLTLTAVHSESHDDIIRSDVGAVIEKLLERWNDGDLLGAMGMYMNSPDVRLVRDGEVYEGWRNIYDHYQGIFALQDADAHGVTNMTEIVIEPMNANTATVFYRWETNGFMGHNEMHGATFLVVKRSGPYWRITHASMSTSLPNLGKAGPNN